MSGLITPTGLATDKTTSPFFADMLNNNHLLAFYDFENEEKIFTGVHNQFRFAVSIIAGRARIAPRSRFSFLTRRLVDVPERRFTLTPGEITAMNPNTGTLPMFRTRKDAEICLGIYLRHPIILRRKGTETNPWGVSFCRMFDMANDADLFYQFLDLDAARFDGWAFKDTTREYLPLYEAKLLGHFDHRFSTYEGATQAQLNKGTLPRLTPAQHDNPDAEPLARYWIDRTTVDEALKARWSRDWILGWRDITKADQLRTFIPSVLPGSAVGHKFPLAFLSNPSHGPLLHAIWSSMVFDYLARQKISGTGMTYFVVEQLPCPTPATFGKPTPWQPDLSLKEWIQPYILELSYTSWRLQSYAREMHDNGPPFRWEDERRSLLWADIDAAFFHIYGLTQPEAEHVLDSFRVMHKYEDRDHGEYRTRRLVLDAYDRMSKAAGGASWSPSIGLPAGQGPRHARQRPKRVSG
jgi:hypothetical protein